jgi:MYXO-CTERM domain-containing protein
MNKHHVAIAAAIAATCAAPHASADVLVDNLFEPQRGTTLVDSSLWAAQSFVTSSDAVTLQGLELWLGERVDAPAITAELRADSAGGPAATLASFSLPALTAGATQIEWLPALSQLELAPSTPYWIVLGVTGAGSFGWTYAEGNNQTGPGALASYDYSTDAGSSWADFGSDNPYLVRVSVSPVPEAPTAALLLAGAALLAALRRRRD